VKRAAKETAKKSNGDKPKAQKVNISQLVVLSAHAKTFNSGKKGFFGKVMDASTGQRYQVVGAVEIAG
jgi:hypothetical protein